MKKMFMLMVIVLLSATFNISYSGSNSPYHAPGAANSRLDWNASSPQAASGSWVQTENHAGDWGSSGCLHPGASCHFGDWYTWWYTTEPPKPNGNWISTYNGGIPTGYDAMTGQYIF